MMRNRESSVGIAVGYEQDDRGFISLSENIFSHSAAPRAALGSNQFPLRWVSVALSLGLKRSGREADHSPPFSA
jgi:hypothetical protein